MNIETFTYKQSDALEAFLVAYGYTLCDAVKGASRADELDTLNEFIVEYGALASAYSISVKGFREDLGVGLNEAALMKRKAITERTHNKEWRHFYEETLAALDMLQKSLKMPDSCHFKTQ